MDNTIYPVISIGNVLFKPIIDLIISDGFEGNVEILKKDIMRKPFQYVAEKHQLQGDIVEKANSALSNLTYDFSIQPFFDYRVIETLSIQKHLVTSGFTKMQWSKIKRLDIEADFDSINIIDKYVSEDSKALAFKRILSEFSLHVDDVIAIGDDPDSELEAANSIGIDGILYDSLNLYQDYKRYPRITSFFQLETYL